QSDMPAHLYKLCIARRLRPGYATTHRSCRSETTVDPSRAGPLLAVAERATVRIARVHDGRISGRQGRSRYPEPPYPPPHALCLKIGHLGANGTIMTRLDRD